MRKFHSIESKPPEAVAVVNSRKSQFALYVLIEELTEAEVDEYLKQFCRAFRNKVRGKKKPKAD